MQRTATKKHSPTAVSAVPSKILFMRLATGLTQGAALYLLYRAAGNGAWPASHGALFAPLLMLALFMPVLLLASLCRLKRKQAAIWLGTIAVVIAALAWHDIWRTGRDDGPWSMAANGARLPLPSPLLMLSCAVGCFIAHALVLAGAIDRRRIASYPTYFETAWKLLIQFLCSLFLVGMLWLALWFAATTFILIDLWFLDDFLQRPWVAIPLTSCAFAYAIHIVDARPYIVFRVRTLLLGVLARTLPVAAALVASFLLSLAWTGLAPFWAMQHATAALLCAAAVLVVLINAAFQNGNPVVALTGIVRFGGRIAALSLLPVTVLAMHALGLRVGEYGWTGNRILAAACLLVAACYAIGYAWAACGRTGWLRPVAQVNIAAAFLILAALLALLSPLADPARMAVDSQMARLAAGRVAADRFDFDYLGSEGERYGRAALTALASRTQGADAARIRELAASALRRTGDHAR